MAVAAAAPEKMGKSKGKSSARIGNPVKKQAASSAAGTPTAGPGPSRVFFLRHGQSEANAQKIDVPDALLTELGRVQAQAWHGAIGRFDAQLVLVSPLRRAIQTALLAYASVDVHVEICRNAREMWWDEKANTPSTEDELRALLAALPRGEEVCGLEQALDVTDAPKTEQESIRALKQELASRSEDVVCVVCHWGVINAMCGENADNCQVVECRRTPNGQYIVEKHHDAPRAPRTK